MIFKSVLAVLIYIIPVIMIEYNEELLDWLKLLVMSVLSFLAIYVFEIYFKPSNFVFEQFLGLVYHLVVYILCFNRFRSRRIYIYFSTLVILNISHFVCDLMIYESIKNLEHGWFGTFFIADYWFFFLRLMMTVLLAGLYSTIIRKMVTKQLPHDVEMVYFFFGLIQFIINNMFLYTILEVNSGFIITISGTVSLVFIGVQYFAFVKYAKISENAMLYDTYGSYMLALSPVLERVSEKERELYQMIDALNKDLPLDRLEIDRRIMDIKENTFIRISFTNDVLFNALLFKYYLQFQEFNINLESLIPGDIGYDERNGENVYQLMELFFKLCGDLVEDSEAFTHDEGSKTQILVKVAKVNNDYKFMGRIEGKIINFKKLNLEVDRFYEYLKGMPFRKSDVSIEVDTKCLVIRY